MKRTLLALVLLVWFGPAAAAGQAQKPTLDSRIDVRVDAVPATDVFRQIISGLGYELQMDASIDAPVTLWVTHVTARTALNVVCESVGCTWRTDGNRLVVSQRGNVIASGRTEVKAGFMGKTDAEKKQALAIDLRSRFRKPLPIDMQFQDVPVSTILRALSEVSGLEITAEEPLASKHVTLIGSGKTVEDAIKAVTEQAGGGGIVTFSVSDRSDPAGLRMRMAFKLRPGTTRK
jgi:hypothetical protein